MGNCVGLQRVNGALRPISKLPNRVVFSRLFEPAALLLNCDLLDDSLVNISSFETKNKFSVKLLMLRTKDEKLINVNGVGIVTGTYYVEDILGFVDKYVTLDVYQKPYVLRMHNLPNFCTLFDFDLRFEKHTVISNEQVVTFGQQIRDITRSVTGKSVNVLLTRKEEL